MLTLPWGVVGFLSVFTVFEANLDSPPATGVPAPAVWQKTETAPAGSDWQIELQRPPQVWEVAFQIQGATYSRLGATGNMRDTHPTFGHRGSYAARNSQRSRGYAHAYRTPPPLITSEQAARRAVNYSVFGGRRYW